VVLLFIGILETCVQDYRGNKRLSIRYGESRVERAGD
jgi:hypothetical protein